MSIVQYENDQYENVLGNTKYGATSELPSRRILATTVSYFFSLGDWEYDIYPLVPGEIRHRVSDRPGVYMLWLSPPIVHKNNGEYDGFTSTGNTRLAYIGDSRILATRLSSYAMAVNPDRPPVYQVVRDRIMREPKLAYPYLTSSPREMRMLRRQWMMERNLSFQVAYTVDKQAARDLQNTMIRYCDKHGIVLWNTLLYKTGVTWPKPGEIK